MASSSLLLWFYWDPPREIFVIPYLEHPVVWYGVCFAFGFFISYFVLYYLFTTGLQERPRLTKADIGSWDGLMAILKAKPAPSPFVASVQHRLTQLQPEFALKAINAAAAEADILRGQLEMLLAPAVIKGKRIVSQLLDSMAWYIVIGTVVGARLGHVFFYDWSYYRDHLLAILKVWEGGLASHGATVGILTALALFYAFRARKLMPDFSFLEFIDLFAIPVPLAGACIRIGNFMNQEIIGTPSSLPWAVFFGNPFEGGEAVPRHPVQLYEALAYLAIFGIAFSCWYFKRKSLTPGFLSGFVLTAIFVARFFLEWFKYTQGSMFDETYLHTGQILSLPFIVIGLLMAFLGYRQGKPSLN